MFFQEFIQWVRNTWRVTKLNRDGQFKQYKLTELVWRKDRDQVFEEIAKLMDIDSADTTTEGWFQHRTKACKNILNGMTDAERNTLRQEAEDLAERGWSEDYRRR
jgi:hypothetical protein